MTTNNIPPRWYMITKDGAATLCVDEYDARQNVIDADILYPNNAPHVAVQLAPVQPAMPVGEWQDEMRMLVLEYGNLFADCSVSDQQRKTAFMRVMQHARRRIEGSRDD